ncbi:protein NDNF [Caerostris extrusa]|uniref:Protein NDNF n=1 Tax=Caerostris extrusa TaxID=172846 RepID=A0AAV4RI81_CAEEX|nr:protein NDNF [Caerostris extrusa]
MRPLPTPSATYHGRERSSYNIPGAPPGTYSLEMRLSSDGFAKVLVTTRSPDELPFHPPLPPQRSLQINRVKRNKILVSWQPSLTTKPHQYCVAMNNRGNYNSMCSAESDQWSGKHGTTITCVGHKTWHQFKGLQRGKTYHFDAFVLDTATNASSTYIGVSATLRGAGGTPHQRFKDDDIVTYKLDESNRHAVNTKYHVGKTKNAILVFVQSCTGPGPVNLHITTGGSSKQDIMSTTVLDIKTLRLPPTNASSWLCLFTCPQDKSIRVFESLNTCHSITIGWKTSADERVKYCIYKKDKEQNLSEPQDFCESYSTGVLVLCRRYHRFSNRRFSDLIMQKIKGLQPDTKYLLEVQVTKVKGEMLPYEQVWARTAKTCSKKVKTKKNKSVF